MAKQALTKEEKKAELNRVRDILLATIDYDLTTRSKIITNDFNSDEYYSNLKNEIEEKFQKGRLATLNQWLCDFTEGPRETKDLEYCKYIKQATGHSFNIFEIFSKRIEKIIEKKKVSTENQYRDIMELINYLSVFEPENQAKLGLLQKLASDFEAHL
jgi:hypothetical protein